MEETHIKTPMYLDRARLEKSKPKIFTPGFYILCYVFKSDLQMIIKSTFVTTDTILCPVVIYSWEQKVIQQRTQWGQNLI